MEKVKTFLFYHGEKVGLAAVLVLCALGLLAAQPWDTSIREESELRVAVQELTQAVASSSVVDEEYDAPDFVGGLKRELDPPVDVRPLDRFAFYRAAEVPETSAFDYPRVAAVTEVRVTAERGRLKVFWSVDPERQGVENAQGRHEGIIELVKAVIYRAPVQAPEQLREIGSTELADVVIVPPERVVVSSSGRRPTPPARARTESVAFMVPPGKASSEDAEAAGRFVYADGTVEPEGDYVYKVKLVAHNPRFDPSSPGRMPPFIESDLAESALSLAQRALPSIRWFFVGGGPDTASVRVYRWHVFSLAAEELAGEEGAEGAAAAATVEQSGWVGVTLFVRPGDPMGGVERRWFLVPGTSKQEQVEVDFSTGCTVVAVESAPRIMDMPTITLTAAGAPGPRPAIRAENLLLYYTDEEGTLRTRWQESDVLQSELAAAPGEGAAASGRERPGRGAETRSGRPMSRAQAEAMLRRARQQEDERIEQQRQEMRRRREAEEQERRVHEERDQYIPEQMPPF
jgi:hypothetical protein